MKKLKSCLLNFLYNLDRAIASLFGAPPQETISSETGRAMARSDHDLDDVPAEILGKALNEIQPGHTDHAIAHADKLDAVDDGKEG